MFYFLKSVLTLVICEAIMFIFRFKHFTFKGKSEMGIGFS